MGVNLKKIPEIDNKDLAHNIMRAGINLIPGVGGSLATVFETVFSAPIDKRKEEWLVSLAKTVDELCEIVENLSLEKLSKDEEFVSIILQTSNIAIRMHEKEKLIKLRNAVKNSILIENIDEIKKVIFIRIIDQVTLLHFRVLSFLSSPEYYIDEIKTKTEKSPNTITSTYYSSLSPVWDLTYDDIKSDNPLLDLIVSELKNYGLVNINAMYEAPVNSSCITSLGKEFIRFTDN